MFFLLPFRTKNPPESFPYCTLALIVVNFLVFFCTIEDWQVTDWATQGLAVSYDHLTLWRLITSLFLHANPLHIIGNMLFLWLFGPSVEGRLKAWRFLLIYFTAGILGGWLCVMVVGVNEPHIPELGASGAIMGVLGAYMYMFPFSQVSVFWFFIIRCGVAQWQAMWLIGFFVGEDIIFGYFQAKDGTAHVAHLAGFALGYVITLLFRPHTDSEMHSKVKSTLSELKDVRILTLNELEVLVRQPTADSKLILAYCARAASQGDDRQYRRSIAMLQRHYRQLVDQTEPTEFAPYLLGLPPNERILPGLVYIRTGTRLEQLGATDLAYTVYHRLYEIDPVSRDAESALYRIARLLETAYANPRAALETYTALMRQFPVGSMALECEAAIVRTKSLLAPSQQAERPSISTPRPASQLQRPEQPDRPPEPQEINTQLGSGRILEI
jgi:membrane associated rhomboid family serine protease